MIPLLPVCWLALLPGLVPGCMQAKGAGPVEHDADAAWAEAWVPRPVALRIYPSTRFVNEGDTTLLEARIELFDQMGDSIKSSGQLRFELHGGGTAGLDTGRLLYSWEVALADLEDQRQYYDPIVRGYLMRLRLDSDQISRSRVELRVTFQPVLGERLTDAQPVRISW
jgi:hypothetical protein